MKPTLYVALRTIIFDYVLNRFMDTVDESLTNYMDLEKLKVGMLFDTIIYKNSFLTTEYLDCEILEIGKFTPLTFGGRNPIGGISGIQEDKTYIRFSYKKINGGLYFIPIFNLIKQMPDGTIPKVKSTTTAFTKIRKCSPGILLEIQNGDNGSGNHLSETFLKHSFTIPYN